MRIAIVDRALSFSDRWLDRARSRGFAATTIDPYDNDIIERLRVVDAFLWHVPQYSPRDELLARHLIYSAELMGVRTFPSTATYWAFDDKLAQKYLLEAAGLNFVPTYVFYDKASALRWITDATFPLVHKLRCGAGSRNVRLVRSRREASRIVDIAFGTGFPVSSGNFEDAAGKLRSGRIGSKELIAKLLRAPATLRRIRRINKNAPRERGYVYFQEFQGGNAYDTRVTVVGDRAFAFMRRTRQGDFRASGSGDIDYDDARIDTRCVADAFVAADLFKTQSLCLDFVLDARRVPRIIETSYVYDPAAVHRAGGYWDRHLSFVPEPIWPQDAIFDALVDSVDSRREA